MNTKDKLHFKTLDKMWSLVLNSSPADKKKRECFEEINFKKKTFEWSLNLFIGFPD